MKSILFALFLLIGTAFCTESTDNSTDSVSSRKYLHISTIPSGADIFVGNLAPDYGHNPDYASPQFIPVEGNEVLLAIFKPEFSDTLLYVNLSKKDTSYLIVSLKPSYDDDLIEQQQKQISKRSRRNLGKKLMVSSIIPFAVAAASAVICGFEANEARDSEKFLKNSLIAQGDAYRQAKDDLKERRSSAKHAKNTALAATAVGAALLSVGFILSF